MATPADTPVATGVFGGTFDPFHRAHLRIARAFMQETGCARLHVVPAGRPYHRPDDAVASPGQRLAMTRLALADEPGMLADPREIERGRPSYTIDTLEEIRTLIGPDAPLWFLVGADAFAGLPRWHRWQDLLQVANLAVALRPGFDPARLPPLPGADRTRGQVPDFPNRSVSGTIRPLTLPPIDLSATGIRSALARGEDVGDALDARVLAYIRQQGLYL